MWLFPCPLYCWRGKKVVNDLAPGAYRFGARRARPVRPSPWCLCVHGVCWQSILHDHVPLGCHRLGVARTPLAQAPHRPSAGVPRAPFWRRSEHTPGRAGFERQHGQSMVSVCPAEAPHASQEEDARAAVAPLRAKSPCACGRWCGRCAHARVSTRRAAMDSLRKSGVESFLGL